jgi:hypothetical protein
MIAVVVVAAGGEQREGEDEYNQSAVVHIVILP